MISSVKNIFFLIFFIVGFVSFFLPWMGVDMTFMDVGNEVITGLGGVNWSLDRGDTNAAMILLVYPVVFLLLTMDRLNLIRLNKFLFHLLKLIPFGLIVIGLALLMIESGFSFDDLSEFYPVIIELSRIGLLITILASLVIVFAPRTQRKLNNDGIVQ